MVGYKLKYSYNVHPYNAVNRGRQAEGGSRKSCIVETCVVGDNATGMVGGVCHCVLIPFGGK